MLPLCKSRPCSLCAKAGHAASVQKQAMQAAVRADKPGGGTQTKEESLGG